MFFWICQNVKKNKQKRYVFQMGKIWLIIQVNVHYILSYGLIFLYGHTLVSVVQNFL